MTRWVFLSLVLTALAFTCSAWKGPDALANLPERVPIHWNIRMEPDGWATRDDIRSNSGFYLYGLPVVMLGLTALGVILPAISPQQFSVEGFRSVFDLGMSMAVGLIGYIHAIIFQSTFTGQPPSSRWLFGGMFLFFAAIGGLMARVRQNFWMGVRTPWTLASTKVWDATHRLASKLWLAGGLIGCLLTMLLSASAMGWIFSIILIVLLYPVPYSLWLYKHLEKTGQLESQLGLPEPK